MKRAAIADNHKLSFDEPSEHNSAGATLFAQLDAAFFNYALMVDDEDRSAVASAQHRFQRNRQNALVLIDREDGLRIHSRNQSVVAVLKIQLGFHGACLFVQRIGKPGDLSFEILV